jgi:hypothetical protein
LGATALNGESVTNLNGIESRRDPASTFGSLEVVGTYVFGSPLVLGRFLNGKSESSLNVLKTGSEHFTCSGN